MSYLLGGQDFKIQFSHIPIGQGVTSKDSVKVVNSIGGVVSNETKSNSYFIGSGFFNATQNLLAEPPVISDFSFPSIIEKNGDPIVLSATIYDLNGIDKANLIFQKGGTDEELVFPMSMATSGAYEVLIPDSLIDQKNFRARIVSTDNMSNSTTSNYTSTRIQFNNSELTMENEYSFYPNGIEKGRWRLMSWPSHLKNTSLAFSELSDGHVFYIWEPVKKSYSVANQIKAGQAYWFRHNYNESVIFQEDTSFALPLNEFVIELEKGWNLVSNPFSFPVSYNADTSVSPPITYESIGIKEGWSAPKSKLFPWNGYAIYANERATMRLSPFNKEDTSVARMASNAEWYLNIKVDSEKQVNYSAVIGRIKHAINGKGMFDVPVYPAIEKSITAVMDLDGSTGFNYMRDIRSLDNFNGVWNLRLENLEKEFTISSNQIELIPKELHVGIVNINERSVILDFLNHDIKVSNVSNNIYDLKIIAGDEAYVQSMSRDILSNIPKDFSLGQNYPNPFNPVTQMDYSLPMTGKVTISVYNILGQEVKTLINKEQDYGLHSISWDGTDKLGNSVASGLYVTQMRSNGYSQSTKMLLLK